MNIVSLQDAHARLPDLIHSLAPGGEVVITENGQPIARLTVAPSTSPLDERPLGTMKGSVLAIAPDFDAPLDDFQEYMP